MTLDYEAIAAYTRAIKASRRDYLAHPTVTPSHRCPTCTGWSHSSVGKCQDCKKEESDARPNEI